MGRLSVSATLALAVCSLASCGDPLASLDAPPAPCAGGVDGDGDGYGEGCPAGADCDDTDPGVHDDCAACSTEAARTGCPCDRPGEVTTCFSGTADQASRPPCSKGTITCSASGFWGVCAGEVPPAFESCDGIDNDCDGTVDDGVLSACGDCTPGCDLTGIGDTGSFPMPDDPPPPGASDVTADGVGLDPNGDLVLDSESIEYHFLWVANAAEGTVSKLDTRTGFEVARYASVSREVLVDAMGGANPALVPPAGAANSPSRTAVDFFGNVWVANRAFPPAATTYQATATKILNNPSECRDRDGDGLETSHDANGDGVIALGDPAEYFGERDECIAFTVMVGRPLGAGEAGARAAAIDRGIDPGDPGNAWIGLFSEQAFYQLDGATGNLVRRVPSTGALGTSPYGAAIDSAGRLWAPNGCCAQNHLTEINTTTGEVIGHHSQPSLGCNGSYGIAIDLADRVWLGAWSCGGAITYDPVGGTWAYVPVPGYHGAGWGTRGLGADALGNVWVALHPTSFSADGVVARIATDTRTATGVWDMVGGVPVGAAVDFDGNVWTVNQTTNNASRLYIDPVTREPAAHPATGNLVDVSPVGSGPYTYSDFTGLGLRTITRASGDYTVVLEGCADGQPARWSSVAFDSTVPVGTSVEIWVRPGDDLAALASWPLYGAWVTSPANLQAFPGPVPDSRYLQLVVRLISVDRTSTPIVHALGLEWACPNVPVP